jgi:hypothetical protein
MSWEKPSFVEVTMSSEIGGYQEDTEERRPGERSGTALPADHIPPAPSQPARRK